MRKVLKTPWLLQGFSRYIFSLTLALMVSLPWCVNIKAQSFHLVSGYDLAVVNPFQLNNALDENNDLVDWNEKSFRPIRFLHAAQFGIRRSWSSGFIGLNWSQRLAGATGETFANGSRFRERLSMTWTSLQLEAAFTLYPISIGSGLHGYRYKTALAASYNEDKVFFQKDNGLASSIFVEIAIGPARSPTQLVLRPYYLINWSSIQHAQLVDHLVGFPSNTDNEYPQFWGIALLLKNGG